MDNKNQLMRLDKFISHAKPYSRTEVKKLIKQGAVYINGTLAFDSGQKINIEHDKVIIDGQGINLPQLRYIMLHKPINTVCTNHDSEHPTVLDLLNIPYKASLQIAGRLDKDTTGLVLLTDDGQWNHRVTSPTKTCRKRYEVSLESPLDEKLIEQFAQGLQLKGEKKVLKPAKLMIVDSYHAILDIEEGKYHQVKRMFAAVNNHVTKLHRTHIGPIELDKGLQLGQYRSLTPKEVTSFAH